MVADESSRRFDVVRISGHPRLREIWVSKSKFLMKNRSRLYGSINQTEGNFPAY